MIPNSSPPCTVYKTLSQKQTSKQKTPNKGMLYELLATIKKKFNEAKPVITLQMKYYYIQTQIYKTLKNEKRFQVIENAEVMGEGQSGYGSLPLPCPRPYLSLRTASF